MDQEKILSKLGFTEEDLIRAGIEQTKKVEQRTTIFCPSCKEKIFIFKGDVDFKEKAINIDDIEPIDPQKIDPLCHCCGSPWVVDQKIENVVWKRIFTSRGWIPKIGIKGHD